MADDKPSSLEKYKNDDRPSERQSERHSSERHSERHSDHKSEQRSEKQSSDKQSERKKADSKASSEGSVKSSSKRKIWERVIKEDSKEEPTFIQKCMRNKLIVAAVVGVLTAVLLVALNPPMIQEKPTDAVSVPGRSVKKVLAWSALAAGLTLLIPMCLKWYGASKQA